VFAGSLLPEVPDAMRRQGHLPDPEFEPFERLSTVFLKATTPWVLPSVDFGCEARIFRSSTGKSVEAGKARRSAWVCVDSDLASSGIAAFTVASITGPAISDGGGVFSWRVDHVPE
jgi:hypothetical protein